MAVVALATFVVEADNPLAVCDEHQAILEFLRRKIEAGRVSMRAGRGRLNDDVEAAFASMRAREVRPE
ncbi:MAG: hypothetical protein D084_Lepto4C00331G0004 [Leptospirillum sp. Group IV 'UBA BS']|nr:MAG: hypothetical protein D084_Lepto4C00331G0004 [Leptospirillum sp. Group IV 'UBA BS']